MIDFFNSCLTIIQDTNIAAKCQLTKKLYNEYRIGQPEFIPQNVISIPEPGHPDKPELVAPFNVPKRKLGNIEGHASLIHALAHIEFNAINLALDACYRFQDMPGEYYMNWLEVAAEEATHFELLSRHLQTLGFSYGDFMAHNGLWEMAFKTEHDILARMAMVPRVLEARGIDAVPEMQKKLNQLNDIAGIAILAIIHRDEIKHVSYGDKWFKYICKERHLDTAETFFQLFDEYNAPKIRGPFNSEDRLKAGFSKLELERLTNLKDKSNEKNNVNL